MLILIIADQMLMICGAVLANTNDGHVYPYTCITIASALNIPDKFGWHLYNFARTIFN